MDALPDGQSRKDEEPGPQRPQKNAKPYRSLGGTELEDCANHLGFS